MAWDEGDTGDAWNANEGAGDWNVDAAGSDSGENWGGPQANESLGGDTGNGGGDAAAGGGGGGLTGECFNCGQVGHNKADCTNAKVERAFTGTCKLCNKEGHRAKDCKERRLVDWTGIPELSSVEAWKSLVNSAKDRDLDAFRIGLRAYARAAGDEFDLLEVENALRTDNLPVYLVALERTVDANHTILDLLGNPDRKFILTFQYGTKPRRKGDGVGWPKDPEENKTRLASAGFVHDRGVPLCDNCGELGHIRKHCKEEPQEREPAPGIKCIYCSAEGHRARDCPQERVNRFACKNCGQEGHQAKECIEPRSAANIECRKCNQMGHFSKDCPNVEKRTCRNCGSEDHMAKDCDQPRNPQNVTCHNCDQLGHFSRDCLQAKDWSKVKCSNCGEMGHTIKRCKAPVTEDNNDNGGGGETSGEVVPGDWAKDQGDDAGEAMEINNWNGDGGSGGW